MILSEKYYNIYMRFLKEECPKYVSKREMYSIYKYKEIVSSEILPHLYYLPNNKRKLFVKTILNEYSSDIVSILTDRLELVGYSNFKDKKSFIKNMISNCNIYGGLTDLDNKLSIKNNNIIVPSISMVKNIFFHSC